MSALAQSPVARRTLRAVSYGDALVAGGLVVSLLLWVLDLHRIQPQSLGDYGLLASQSVAWYLALALTIGCAIAGALGEGRNRHFLFVGAIGLLILIIHATPAIEYALPRYTWTFKHFGVVDYLDVNHRLARNEDIYFNWPGFFAAADWLHRATGLSLFTMARWSPPAFEAMMTAGVLFFARSVTRDLRVARLATLLYLLANWIGQDYFAPQAMSLALAMIVLGAVIHLTRRDGARLWGELPDGNAVLLVTILVTWFAILTSHQLTPVVLLLDVALIVLLRRRRQEWWLLGVLFVSELAWVGLALPYLENSHYPLLSVDPLSNTSKEIEVPKVLGPGARLRTDAVALLYFGLFAVGLLRGIKTWKTRPDNRLVLGLAVVPPMVLLVQSYGGEGQLRTYLFAVPFLTFLLADLLVGLPRPSVRVLGTVAVAAAISVCFLFAYYGQEEVNVSTHGDVAAIEWFYANAPRGSGPVYLAPNTPTRISRDYLEYPIADDALPTLLANRDFARSFTATSAVRFMKGLQGRVYLIITSSQSRYLDYFGIASKERYRALVGTFLRRPELDLVYQRGGAYIWKLRGRG